MRCLSGASRSLGRHGGAQKALSAIYRLGKERGQRYGAGHIIDILRGKSSDRTRQHDHESLSVFGVGADLSETAWRGVLRQLLAKGLLMVDHEGYGTLALTEDSRAVLRGEMQLMLRRESEKKPRSRGGTRAKAPVIDLPADRMPVFEALRGWRAEVARNHGVPAYVIFHDATLREIALALPDTHEALGHISGVGARKLEAYGEEILRCVARPR